MLLDSDKNLNKGHNSCLVVLVSIFQALFKPVNKESKCSIEYNVESVFCGSGFHILSFFVDNIHISIFFIQNTHVSNNRVVCLMTDCICQFNKQSTFMCLCLFSQMPSRRVLVQASSLRIWETLVWHIFCL